MKTLIIAIIATIALSSCNLVNDAKTSIASANEPSEMTLLTEKTIDRDGYCRKVSLYTDNGQYCLVDEFTCSERNWKHKPVMTITHTLQDETGHQDGSYVKITLWKYLDRYRQKHVSEYRTFETGIKASDFAEPYPIMSSLMDEVDIPAVQHELLKRMDPHKYIEMQDFVKTCRKSNLTSQR